MAIEQDRETRARSAVVSVACIENVFRWPTGSIFVTLEYHALVGSSADSENPSSAFAE